MKPAFLFFIIFSLNVFGQQDSALMFYNKGIAAINQGKYRLADSILTQSLRISKHENTYYNRAVAREKLGNVVGFCDDLNAASGLGDNQAGIILCKRCFDNIDTISKNGEQIYQLNFSKKVSTPFGINFKTKKNYLSIIEYDAIKSASEELIKPDNNGVYLLCETPAHFKGGDSALSVYIHKNLKIPNRVIDQKLRGGVMLEFVVEENGSISHIKVFKGLENCVQCSTEAIDLAKSMPAWIPGKIKGKFVKSYVPLLVPFGK